MFRFPAALFSIRSIRRGPFALTWAVLMVAACQPDSPSDEAVKTEVSIQGDKSSAVDDTQVTADKPPLIAVGRASLMTAFASAADATAAGRPLPDLNKQLVGRTFTLRFPFSCDSHAGKEERSWAGWTFDQSKRTLKLFAAPERWNEAGWVKSIAGDAAYEAVEGFWIDRPWTSSEECPVSSRPDIDSVTSVPLRQTAGIAQFFAPDSPRTFQRGTRAYAHTIRVRDGEEITGRNFRLSVDGRVTGFPDGQPIRCWQDSPNLRPVCLMAVELARVAFEDSPAGNVLVEWRN